MCNSHQPLATVLVPDQRFSLLFICFVYSLCAKLSTSLSSLTLPNIAHSIRKRQYSFFYKVTVSNIQYHHQGTDVAQVGSMVTSWPQYPPP